MGRLGARAVDKRMRFVTAAETSEETMTALCRRFGFSRKTGYKWLERYRLDGLAGLSERSRAPHAHPQAVSAAIAERCLAVRKAHRSWGPVKVRAWLERDDPATPWPAASTIGELFDREGLTVKRKLRRRCPPSSAPFAACGDANTVWCIDFKGWFLTGDGTHCEPLTLSHKSTGPTTTATELNETGKLLPMSSVRSVTHVAGCSEGVNAAAPRKREHHPHPDPPPSRGRELPDHEQMWDSDFEQKLIGSPIDRAGADRYRGGVHCRHGRY